MASERNHRSRFRDGARLPANGIGWGVIDHFTKNAREVLTRRRPPCLMFYVDDSVSKTINLPQEASKDVVAAAYRRAWELGLKGITIYRFGSKSTQVIELGESEDARSASTARSAILRNAASEDHDSGDGNGSCF